MWIILFFFFLLGICYYDARVHYIYIVNTSRRKLRDVDGEEKTTRENVRATDRESARENKKFKIPSCAFRERVVAP